MAARKELSGLAVLGTLTLDGAGVVATAADILSRLNTAGNNQLTGGLGVGGARPDATNRLSVNGPAVLLNNAGAGIDMKFNKAAGNDAALTFQTGFTTHALMGLLANNDYTLKVGASFTTAMVADNATGRVSFPAGIKQIQVGTTAPASPAVGDIWVDTN